MSAINTVATCLGTKTISSSPTWLRQHLATISPAMAGLTNGSWWFHSRILRALSAPRGSCHNSKPL